MKKKKSRLLIVTGATGGHFFPALTLFRYLKKSETEKEVCLVVPARVLSFYSEIVSESNVFFCPDVNFSKGKISGFFSLLVLLVKSFCLFLRFRPKAVLSFGSVSGVFFCLYSVVLRKKLYLHAQNKRWGKAHMFFSGFAEKIAITFPAGKDIIDKFGKKLVLSGLPLREKFLEDLHLHGDCSGLSTKEFNILIMGGSQGAVSVNELAVQAICNVAKSIDRPLNIYNVCGANADVSYIKNEYAKAGIDATVTQFNQGISEWIMRSDLVLTRAGAGTICELCAAGVPSIFIPYPYADKHQYFNAGYLLEKCGCPVFDQVKDDVSILESNIRDLLNDSALRSKMSEKMQALFPDDPLKVLKSMLYS